MEAPEIPTGKKTVTIDSALDDNTMSENSSADAKKGVSFGQRDNGDKGVFLDDEVEDQTAANTSSPNASSAPTGAPVMVAATASNGVADMGGYGITGSQGAMVEEYKYEPEEKGETWDIYKQRSVMNDTSKRKSEDAVLIKAKMDAEVRQKAVASAVRHATADFEQGVCAGSEGRTQKGRTAIAQTGLFDIPTDEEISRTSGFELGRTKDSLTSVESDESVDSQKAHKGGRAKMSEAEAEASTSTEAPTTGAPTTEASTSREAPSTGAPSTEAEEALPSPELAACSAPTHTDKDLVNTTPSSGCHPLEVLQNSCPAGVAPTMKEEFLGDADFEAVFKMSREAFTKLPAWKRNAAKKTAGLF